MNANKSINQESAMNNGIIDSSDPRAVLRAWLGDWDMGGWPSSDEASFRRAVVDSATKDLGISADDLDEISIESVEH